jgi:hypothetical protein
LSGRPPITHSPAAGTPVLWSADREVRSSGGFGPNPPAHIRSAVASAPRLKASDSCRHGSLTATCRNARRFLEKPRQSRTAAQAAVSPPCPRNAIDSPADFPRKR